MQDLNYFVFLCHTEVNHRNFVTRIARIYSGFFFAFPPCAQQ